jgi:hypothetical protein
MILATTAAPFLRQFSYAVALEHPYDVYLSGVLAVQVFLATRLVYSLAVAYC